MHIKELFCNRILIRLGIGGAALLLYWLMGGLPPVTWIELFQAISQSSSITPHSPAGQGLFSPLFLLALQSFCLLLAWSALVWLAACESVFVLRERQRRQISYTSGGYGSGNPLGEEQTMEFALHPGGDKGGAAPGVLIPPLSPHSALTSPIMWNWKPGDAYMSWQESPGEPIAVHNVRREDTRVLQDRAETQTSAICETAPLSNGYVGPRIHARSHTGLVRAGKPNEDSYLQLAVVRQSPDSSPQWAGLFLVADGMGGHDDGKYASSFVVDAIASDLKVVLRDPQQSSEDLKQSLVEAVKRANIRLFQANTDANIFRGTTLTGAVLLEETAWDEITGTTTTHVAHVVNVGDSRTYRHSISVGFRRVTRDHSTVENLIALHLISPEERYTHASRNEINRCLGDKEDIEVDVFTLALQPHDRLLLCSDGLWEMVRDAELASLVSMPTERPSHITSALILEALKQGGKDNVTALMIMIPGNKGE